jgi:hypothetical protein
MDEDGKPAPFRGAGAKETIETQKCLKVFVQSRLASSEVSRTSTSIGAAALPPLLAGLALAELADSVSVRSRRDAFRRIPIIRKLSATRLNAELGLHLGECFDREFQVFA